MLLYLVSVLFVASAQALPHFNHYSASAASPAQIRFAYENKFDDTGPGAKSPEYAYKTYKNLDDALVAYADDPDTQLPASEKARAIANLYRNNDYKMYYKVDSNPPSFHSGLIKVLNYNQPKTVEPFARERNVPFVKNSYTKYDNKEYIVMPVHNDEKATWKEQEGFKSRPNFRPPQWKSLFPNASFKYQYMPHPDVEFSVDVHDKETGDTKTAQELRDGSGTIHGYYAYVDDEGRSRSVQYLSNPQSGVKSSVQRVY